MTGSRQRTVYSFLISLFIMQFIVVYALNLTPREEPETVYTETEVPAEPTPAPTPVVSAMEVLEQTLSGHLDTLAGDWSVYVKDIRTNEEIRIHDHRMVSASLIKIFVAGAFYEKVRNGEITVTEKTEKLMDRMLTISDNDAWVELETIIGKGSPITGLQAVTDFAHTHGYTDTGRLISTGNIYDRDAANMTSARDVGYALNEIYKGTFVDMEASNRILDALERQEKTWKIPAGLPPEVESANKTGELEDGYQHDAAIVFAPATDYILVVMSHGDSDDTVFADIAEISSIVYEAIGEE